MCSRDPTKISVDQVEQVLHYHWAVDRGIFSVCDVSYSENRSHARLVSIVMSTIRSLVISIICESIYPFMTDA